MENSEIYQELLIKIQADLNTNELFEKTMLELLKKKKIYKLDSKFSLKTNQKIEIKAKESKKRRLDTKKTEISQLPKVVMSLILRFVLDSFEPKSTENLLEMVLNLKTVNKNWNDIVSMSLWKNINLSLNSTLFYSLPFSKIKPVSLFIDVSRLKPLNDVVFPKLTTLKKLILKNPKEVNTEKFYENSPNIEEIKSKQFFYFIFILFYLFLFIYFYFYFYLFLFIFFS